MAAKQYLIEYAATRVKYEGLPVVRGQALMIFITLCKESGVSLQRAKSMLEQLWRMDDQVG